jgi:hypothetical protein
MLATTSPGLVQRDLTVELIGRSWSTAEHAVKLGVWIMD